MIVVQPTYDAVYKNIIMENKKVHMKTRTYSQVIKQ